MNQFVKFILVGIANTSLGYAVIFSCMYLVGLSAVNSNIIGYFVGLTISYALNRGFIFKSQSKPKSEFARFLAVFLFAYLANLGVLISLLRYSDVNEGVAQVLAGLFYVFTTFLLNKYYVFRNLLVK